MSHYGSLHNSTELPNKGYECSENREARRINTQLIITVNLVYFNAYYLTIITHVFMLNYRDSYAFNLYKVIK